MLLALLMTDQMASSVAVHFDLRDLQPVSECKRGARDSGEIVVCAPSDSLERFRLRQLPDRKFEPAPVRAETGLIGNVKIAAEAEQTSLTTGTVSNRMMVRFKIPF